MNKGKRALLIISAVLLLVALAFVAYMVFRVREVAVLGCETLDVNEVVDISGLEYGQNTILLDKQSIMDKLAGDPRIKPVSVEPQYPDRVVITIEERKPAGYIEKNGSLIVIDDEGWILEVSQQSIGSDLPMIYGLQADAFEVGQPLGSGDMFRMDVLTRVLGAAEAAEIGLDSLDVTLPVDIVITTNGLTVELGDDTELDTKMNLVKTSLKEIAALGKECGQLDVSSVHQAYFREKSS